MDRAEDVVDELRRRVRPCLRTSSSASRSRPSPSTSSCASEKNSSRALSPASPRPPPPSPWAHGHARAGRTRARWSPSRRGAPSRRSQASRSCSGVNGLARYALAPRASPRSTSCSARMRRDDDERRRPVVLRLADEVDELEAVDVGHVDVGDDEVVGPARQQAHRVEAAAGLRRPRSGPPGGSRTRAPRGPRARTRGPTPSLRRPGPCAWSSSKRTTNRRACADNRGVRDYARTAERCPTRTPPPPCSSSATRSCRARSRRRTSPSSRGRSRALGVLLRRVVVVMDDVDAIAREVRELSRDPRLALHERRRRPDARRRDHRGGGEGVRRRRVVSSPEMEAMLRAHYRERCTEGTCGWRSSRRAPRSR